MSEIKFNGWKVEETPFSQTATKESNWETSVIVNMPKDGRNRATISHGHRLGGLSASEAMALVRGLTEAATIAQEWECEAILAESRESELRINAV